MFEGVGKTIQVLMVGVVVIFVLGVAGIYGVSRYRSNQTETVKKQQEETMETLGQVYKARIYMQEKKLLVSAINVWPRSIFPQLDPDLPNEVLLFEIPDDPGVQAKRRSFAVVGKGTEMRKLWFTEPDNVSRPIPCKAEFCK